MVRFTIPAGHKAGACCASESYRYGLANALAYRGQGNGLAYVVATDGKCLTVLPLADAGPERRTYLPPKAVAANGKAVTVEANGEVRKTENVSPGRTAKTEVFPLPDQEQRYPPFREVFPKLPDDCLAFTVNVKQLGQVASAISPSGCLTLFIKDNATAMLAVGTNDQDEPTGLGLVMPFKADKTAALRAYAAQHVSEIPDLA